MTKSHVLISCQHNAVELVSSQIRKMEHVQKVEKTIGYYDLVVEMESNNEEQLTETSSGIKDIDLIRSTLMLVHV